MSDTVLHCGFLSGGIKGFDKVVWDVVAHAKGEKPSITFKYESYDGEEGLFFHYLSFLTLVIPSYLFYDYLCH